MSIKRLLCPARVRQVPAQFSWIDQRLVRNRLIGCCCAEALALYLFLLTVADAQGLSYYSDQSIISRLPCLNTAQLVRARTELQAVGWIAYEAPVYQVLALEARGVPPTSTSRSSPPASTPTPKRTLQPVHIRDMLRRALAGRHD